MRSPQGSPNDSKRKWVVVQLTPAGERETSIKNIERSVLRILKKPIEVFVPAMSQKVRNETLTTVYMDGYIFIAYEPGIDYTKLSDTTYFSSVLISGRTYQLLDDSKVCPIRDKVAAMKINEFNVGDKVRVKRGEHKDLPCRIVNIYEGGEHVQVQCDFWSKPMMLDFASSNLKKDA